MTYLLLGLPSVNTFAQKALWPSYHNISNAITELADGGSIIDTPPEMNSLLSHLALEGTRRPTLLAFVQPALPSKRIVKITTSVSDAKRRQIMVRFHIEGGNFIYLDIDSLQRAALEIRKKEYPRATIVIVLILLTYVILAMRIMSICRHVHPSSK